MYAIIPSPMTPEFLDKLAQGEPLSDPDLVGAALHFRLLESLLITMGPAWSMPLQVATIQRIRIEGYIRARGIKQQADGDFAYI